MKNRKHGHFKNYYDYVRLTSAYEGKHAIPTYIKKLYKHSMVRIKLAVMIINLKNFFGIPAGIKKTVYVSTDNKPK